MFVCLHSWTNSYIMILISSYIDRRLIMIWYDGTIKRFVFLMKSVLFFDLAPASVNKEGSWSQVPTSGIRMWSYLLLSPASSPESRPPPSVHFSLKKNTSTMSGSSNLVTMKKVVQQLRFEASINRVKVNNAHIVFCQITKWERGGRGADLNRCVAPLSTLAC